MAQELPPDIEPVLPALLEVSRELNSEKDFDRLLETTIPRVVCELTGAERCTLFLLSIDRESIFSRVALGTNRDIRLKLGEGIAGLVALSGETISSQDPYSDPRFARHLDELTGFKTRNILCVAMRDQSGRVLGVFEVLNKRTGEFDRRDCDVLELLGRHAAVAIEGARTNKALLEAQADLREQVRRMEVLHRIEKQINASEDFEQILSSVILLCAEAVNALAGSILLMENDGARLYFRYTSGEKAAELRRLSLPHDEGIAGWVLREGRPVICNDTSTDSRHSPWVSRELGYSVKNLVAAPLSSGTQRLGVLEVVNRKDRNFDEADLGLVECVASQVSQTLEKKLLVEESRQAQRLAAVGSMAGRVIHDLKNSMSVIRGIAEMMDRKDVPMEKVQYRKRLMLSAIDGLVAMTQDILDFSKGDLQLTLEPLELRQVLEDVFPLLERDCELRRVSLEMAIDGSCVVMGDFTKLKRIFFNLAVNALDVMPQGGRLSVKVTRDGTRWVVIEMTDTGPGISDSVMGRLFKPFVTHGKKYGTGLGLAICKSLVEAHKGRIGAENRKGGGATFSVWLPQAADAAPAAS